MKSSESISILDAETIEREVLSILPVDFEKNIIGALKGEIRDFGVKLPENYLDKDFQGKNIRFKVIVKEIKVKKLPEVDDKFAS